MAVYLLIHRNLSRSLLNTSKCLTKILQCPTHMDTTLELDVFDDFTTQLIEKRINKLEIRKTSHKHVCKPKINKTETVTNDYNLAELNIEKITTLFQKAIDQERHEYALELMRECIKHQKCPPLSILIYILSFASRQGDKELIVAIRHLCNEIQPDILTSHSSFNHYIAEATWIKGNIMKSLEMFEEVYRDNAYLRRRIRLMLKHLINNMMSNRSEAALWKMIEFTKRLMKDYNDFYPLICVWQVCFLSEWFTDQTIALELLEDNEELMKAVINQIPYVVYVSLCYNKTEIVYRLLEVLLKYEMKNCYGSVLVALLDYQFKCRDYRRCSEIINWAVEHNVTMPSAMTLNIIHLLLNGNASDSISMKTGRTNNRINLRF